MNVKNIFIVLIVLLGFNITVGYAQSTTKVIRQNEYSYEVISEMIFPKNVADKLWRFCWDVNNIVLILADKPVVIQFSEFNLTQTISYDYEFFFMHYYSEYERTQQVGDSTISFELRKSKCSIPFIPNLKKAYGTYKIKSNNKTTTLQYYQYAETDGVLRDFYLKYIIKDIESFFDSFESEFNKSLNNANN